MWRKRIECWPRRLRRSVACASRTGSSATAWSRTATASRWTWCRTCRQDGMALPEAAGILRRQLRRQVLHRYRWRAKKWTGGNIKDSKSFSWGCHTGSKVTVQSTVWAARTSTSRSWAQFSIAGIGLDAEQINSSYHKLTLDPVRRTHACGNNGDVLHASRVKEVV